MTQEGYLRYLSENGKSEIRRATAPSINQQIQNFLGGLEGEIYRSMGVPRY